MKLEDVKKIAVIGAGTMGHGIAQIFAQGGYQVSMMSRTQKTLDRAMSLIKASLEGMVAADFIAASEVQATLDRITLCTSVEEACKDVDICFESMLEDKDAKIAIFEQMDKYCPERALLVSNTTFLNPFEFNKFRTDKVLIAHFYAPPQIIPLVDVVKGPDTEMAHVELMAELLRKIGKKPIVFKKFLSGYVISRLQVAIQHELYYLVDNGYLTAREVDDACIWGLAMRMMIIGALGRIDFGGVDLSVKSLRAGTAPRTPADYKPTKIFELADNGDFGVKTGKGFYDFGGLSEAEACKIRDEKLLKMLSFARNLGDALPE